MRAVDRARQLVPTLTRIGVGTSLLICSVAAGAPPTATSSASTAGIASPASVGTLQDLTSTPTTPVAANAPADSELSEVVVQAPEPIYAAPTLRDRIGRIWAPVLINGRGPYRLVLDTGATRSAIVPQVAHSLGIPVGNSATIKVTGVTGTAMVPSVAIERMEVGDLMMDSATLPVVADVFGGAQGVLGTEGLSDKRILIDFGRDKVKISRSRGDVERHGFATLPLRELRAHLLALDVHVGGVRAKAIIDTGAQVSIGNNALRTALARHYTRDVTHEEIEGVTLDVTHGDMMQAPAIDVGGLRFNGVYVTYGDMYIFDRWNLENEPTLVLGMDVLGTVDVLIIDYRLHELQIRLRRSDMIANQCFPRCGMRE